jgi:acyl-CoA thioesterase
MTDTEKMKKLNNHSEFNKYNGIVVTQVDSGTAVVETVLGSNSMNPWGSAHGGLIFAMCDVAAGVAASDVGGQCVTQSGNIYFLRPAVGTKLRAVGTVIKHGKTVSVVETKVYNDADELVSAGQFEYFHTGEE